MTMHTYAIFAGFGLMAAGIAHLLKPDLLRPGIWAKSYATEHNSSPESVAVFNIALGIALLFLAFSST
jgi:hypothetical protein